MVWTILSPKNKYEKQKQKSSFNPRKNKLKPSPKIPGKIGPSTDYETTSTSTTELNFDEITSTIYKLSDASDNSRTDSPIRSTMNDEYEQERIDVEKELVKSLLEADLTTEKNEHVTISIKSNHDSTTSMIANLDDIYDSDSAEDNDEDISHQSTITQAHSFYTSTDQSRNEPSTEVFGIQTDISTTEYPIEGTTDRDLPHRVNSKKGGCHKNYCWAYCKFAGVVINRNIGEWCYTTSLGRSLNKKYVQCKHDRDCDVRWKCASICTL